MTPNRAAAQRVVDALKVRGAPERFAVYNRDGLALTVPLTHERAHQLRDELPCGSYVDIALGES